MILDHSNLSFDETEGQKGNLIQEISKIVILIEFGRKDLLLIMSNYIKQFSEQEKFDFNTPVAYLDFVHFIENNYGFSEHLLLDQLIFNLQLFSIKLYNLCEEDKKMLKDTKIKKLRLTFAHKKKSFHFVQQRKSSDIGRLVL